MDCSLDIVLASELKIPPHRLLLGVQSVHGCVNCCRNSSVRQVVQLVVDAQDNVIHPITIVMATKTTPLRSLLSPHVKSGPHTLLSVCVSNRRPLLSEALVIDIVVVDLPGERVLL